MAKKTLLRLQAGFRLVGCTILLLLISSQAATQVNMDEFRDYFLVGSFGEVCTMCEITVVCEAGDAPSVYEVVPDDGNFTLYYLQTRTFWSQISTIWEWFVVNFSSESLAASGHTRPVHVYTVTDGNWSGQKIIEARLILEPGVIEFGDYHIDRISRAWRQVGTGVTAGYCQRMPLWDTLESIAANAPAGGS